MKTLFRIMVLPLLLAGTALFGQTKTAKDGSVEIDNVARFDKVIHDFGDVLLSDGALSCTFTVSNIGSKAIVIYNVVSSCGCTDVKWTREPMQPGKQGTITAKYSNDEGPYPFDKTLTVYISDIKKPIILRLRGNVQAKKLSLVERYPLKFGTLALKDNEFKLGNMSQGSQRSDQIGIANLGSSPVKIAFANVAPGLELSVSPNPIPAGGEAKISYTITTDRSRWGLNWYTFSLMADGKILSCARDGAHVSRKQVGIQAFTKENFASMGKDEKDRAAQPMFKESTHSFGKIKAGSVVEAKFSMKNNGRSPLKIYKIDSDTPGISVAFPGGAGGRLSSDATIQYPKVAPGEDCTFTVALDSASLPSGTFDIILTLTTNSPMRPIINLFLSGAVQ